MSGLLARLRGNGTMRAISGGMSRMAGFATSMLLLAAASLIAIPAMVAASGPRAMAAIVAGQAIGAVAAVVIAYGWVVTGPAQIARGDRETRLSEYVRSLTLRLTLLLPVAGLAALIAWLVARDFAWFAALGCLSAATIGLTANWYFVGLSRPILLLLFETLPRVAGTTIGIVLMYRGAEADAGLWGMLGGMLGAFALSSLWIVASGTRAPGWWRPTTSVFRILREQIHGVSASAVSAVYAALPIVIVGFVALPVQPGFALLDKFQKQVNAALTAYVSVMQGWVPRAAGASLHQRIRQALLVTAAGSALLAAGIALLGAPVVEWLGNGQIPVSGLAIALMGAVVGMALLGAVLTSACLVALGKLAYMARVTAISSVVGLVLVALLAPQWGVVGAEAGVLAGFTVRVLLGLRALKHSENESSSEPQARRQEGIGAE